MPLTIDGKLVRVAPGTSILEAALANGIDIPRLCYHPDLVPSGGCRMCLVQIEGRPNPQPSCGIECAEGLVVHTQSDLLFKLRHDIIDLFVSDHPLRCAVCDKNGACDLQKYAYEYGISETSFDFEISKPLVQNDNPFFLRDHEMCILCGKCVRVCDEIVGANAIDYARRGFVSHIATPFDMPMVNSSCVFCGSCVQVCPTAALLPMSRLGRGREWELERTRTVCGYCGVGCQVEYAKKNGEILYGQGFRAAPVNGEFLCVKGRFAYDFASSTDRLKYPLVRKELADQLNVEIDQAALASDPVLKTREGKNFVPVSWETALDLTAAKLAETVTAHGADAVAGLASARCTNEENYLFQKFMRASLGTNNVDHCARLCHASSVTGLGMAFGSGAMTNPILDIRGADCILITGSNTAESHPVISYEVVRAVKAGANLIIIDPRRIPLVDHATLWLQPKPGFDQYIFLAMAHVILRDGLADRAFVESRTENFEPFVESIKNYTPEMAALATGVPADQIELAARLYALGLRSDITPLLDSEGPAMDSPLLNKEGPGLDTTLLNREGQGEVSPSFFTSPLPEGEGPGERGNSTILYAMGITQRSNGTELVLMLANLALLTGQVGKPSSGINPLRGQSNVQGACDVGALPNVLPGYLPVGNPEARARVLDAWQIDALPGEPGLTVVDLMKEATHGGVRAMYIMGENPMLSDPDLTHVEQGLDALDFLVVQDIFLNETAVHADVVLPAAAWLEKDGTFTNTERRVQMLSPVLPAPGLARTDWEILCDLGKRVDSKLARSGERWNFSGTAAIMDELARVTPIYGGIHHNRLAGAGLTWPCPDDAHPGTPVLHIDRFSRGRGKFHAVTAQDPYELPDAEYPLILTTGRILYQYHTGTMTRRSEGLAWREPRGYAEINPADAASIGLRDGAWVIIKSRRGQVRTQARIGERVPPGVLFYSFHWKEAPANLLTQADKLDPLARIPEFKVSAVRIENPAAEHEAKKAAAASPSRSDGQAPSPSQATETPPIAVAGS
jgi:predicted molibdopterin-dependent oxidoreductase YjgC